MKKLLLMLALIIGLTSCGGNGKMQTIQKWLNIIVGALFVIIGIYYCIIMYF